MEKGSHNPNNLSQYEQFACNSYDDIDYIMTQRRVPSLYEYFDDRYCKLQLSKQELAEIAEIMLMHFIDPPHSVEIVLKGRNPYTYKDVPQGVAWITMKHNDETRSEVTSEYMFWLDPSEKKPINAFKDVKRAVVRDDANAHGLLSLPLDLSHIYFNEAPIGQDEQSALQSILKHLQRHKDNLYS